MIWLEVRSGQRDDPEGRFLEFGFIADTIAVPMDNEYAAAGRINYAACLHRMAEAHRAVFLEQHGCGSLSHSGAERSTLGLVTLTVSDGVPRAQLAGARGTNDQTAYSCAAAYS
jgi:hypothetical protein